MRSFRNWTVERQRRDGEQKAAVLGVMIVLFPFFAFSLGWQVGVAILAAYAALAFGVWRVSRER